MSNDIFNIYLSLFWFLLVIIFHVNCIKKNIERHTAHTIALCPDPKQWVIVHTSDDDN